MTTILRTLGLALLLLGPGAGACIAQNDHTPNAAPNAPEQHETKGTREMETDEFFTPVMGHHLEPRVLWTPEISDDPEVNDLAAFYNVNLFQLIALALILMILVPVLLSFDRANSPWIVRVFRGWAHWLRDEVVYQLMGREEGERFAPFFIFLFFFIAFMNVLGLFPYSTTATATVFVTGALALVTFAVMVGGGMIRQGPFRYLRNLLPPGLPLWLMPLMAAVELVGLFVKPFALMIRLFANMLAGHLLIIAFVGMIFVFAKMLDLSAFSWGTAIPTVGMAVFINIIESFVVLLQAYIFMYLSVLFVQESLHPAH